ncbi:MAG: MOSC domain-containing protein [Proteobacteria bacterium]|nr:MOSC domain-containing protein [Pseudomonadota bacterium]
MSLSATPPIATLRALLTGRALPYTRPGSVSGIAKQPRSGPVSVGPLGLAGDEQGDPRVHGGPDKAVHCYAWAQYQPWRQELTGNATAQALLSQPGAFGENFCLDGLDESQVCLCDQWQVGSARLEISQGRQPCWKLNDRFGVPDMALRVQTSLRTGWYLRVLQPGQVQAGDGVWLQARPYPEWPIARLLRAIAERDCTPETLREILTLPLPPSWHRLFTRRLESAAAEDWSSRLVGKPA